MNTTPNDNQRDELIDALVMTPMSEFIGTSLRPVERSADMLIAAGWRRDQTPTGHGSPDAGDAAAGTHDDVIEQAAKVLYEHDDPHEDFGVWPDLGHDRADFYYDLARALAAAGLLAVRTEADATLALVREALAGHPRCDVHPDGDSPTCGWKSAVASVQWALDQHEAPPVRGEGGR